MTDLEFWEEPKGTKKNRNTGLVSVFFMLNKNGKQLIAAVAHLAASN